MKKILFGFLAYTIFAGVVAFLVGLIAFPVPSVYPSDVMAYRVSNALIVLMKVLPSVAVTAFLIGCAISFGEVKAPSTGRFSKAVTDCFKPVAIIAIITTCGLSLCHDAFLPFVEQRKAELLEKPIVIKQYLGLSQAYLIKSIKNPENARLALFYSKKVLELDPKNETAASLYKRSEIASASKRVKTDRVNLSFSDGSGIDPKEQVFDSSEVLKVYSSSVYELVLEAEKLMEKKDYLGAHYYAQMAVRMAGPKDVNRSRAQDCANKAWNILSDAKAETATDENMFFRKKVEGYTKLMAGDYLSAYYIFQTLSNTRYEYAHDVDVKRYINIARYELTQDYFFIDETTDKDSFESCENVYFALCHEDGSYDIFFVKGITDINETGNMVRYLRELSCYSFDSYGTFVSHMSVPYAKMLAVDVNTISKETRTALGIESKWKLVPYIMLCSVDRDQEGVRIEPSYISKKGRQLEGQNQMLLTMPFDDFEVISKCTSGVQQMNFWYMNKMKKNASYYGYSDEIILQTVLTSVFYPFMILILLVFTASIGWNYRLSANTLFKFVWALFIPFVNVIFYGAVGFFEFTVKILNFIFMGIAGVDFALYLGIAFYLVWLIVAGVVFLSRKGD